MTAFVLSDSRAMLGRNLRRMRHAPGLFVITMTMPVTMLLFFGYVFGSAMVVADGGYRAYLVPGLLVATAVNGVMTAMLASAQDCQRGVMDRFRTLPMSRFAIPAGQTASDVLLAALGLVPLVLCGLAVGWRIEGGPAGAAGAFALLLLFRLATAWTGHYIGLLVGTEEAAGQLGAATFMLPLLSNAYVPTDGMPGWLRTVAEWNPISAVVTACRDLFGNGGPAADVSWPVAHPVLASVGWCVLLLAVFVPLTVRRYGRDSA
ncbi:ABC transporter permease [Streptomyces albireticuli]|uniref:Transport permease protein n=1 Tax=Streptomyces albireticuli TaxID=1940 RepID=A0A2A2D723_9ACTN|nr:ABC transporter permease [Streptomyces albireticuli]MCD9143489.1 ABC transporter permease [Streptomyces albireticuli]MCD9164848.1 ABC transporter permease [Streptomyces albireticuli]MCD9191606.1 ABC transporter permease [Streptomyces albireticuli]PAU47122.1 multidrug ABC transporter permease [Streptomyces albireticuli]